MQAYKSIFFFFCDHNLTVPTPPPPPPTLSDYDTLSRRRPTHICLLSNVSNVTSYSYTKYKADQSPLQFHPQPPPPENVK